MGVREWVCVRACVRVCFCFLEQPWSVSRPRDLGTALVGRHRSPSALRARLSEEASVTLKDLVEHCWALVHVD